MQVYNLAIDVVTKDAKRLINRLKRLESTKHIENGGMYGMDLSYSQIWIQTTMSENDLDDWLYNVNHGCEYVGIFSRE